MAEKPSAAVAASGASHDDGEVESKVSAATSTVSSGIYSRKDFPKELYRFLMTGTQKGWKFAKWSLDGKAFMFDDGHEALGPLLKEHFGRKFFETRVHVYFTSFYIPTQYCLILIHSLCHDLLFADNAFSATQRKMYRYQFKRHTSGPLKGFFYHPGFTRNDPDFSIIRARESNPNKYNKSASASKKGTVEGLEESSVGGEKDTAVPKELNLEQVQGDDGSTLGQLEDENGVTIPLYDVGTKVLARDADGLLYEAWIRRQLYGPHYHKQVQVGIINDQQEMEEYLEAASQPGWHYFVHYNGWKVNWDRWVSESDVLPLNSKNTELASRITKEHRALQQEFKASSSRRKVDDAGAFLRAWKIRLQRVYEEASGTTATTQPTAVVEKAQTWTKKSLEQEKKMRKKQIESAKSSSKPGAQKIVLPFSLKKILVEEWEIISQCEMVHALPSKMTIRQALDQYLASKGVTRDQSSTTSNGAPDNALSPAKVTNNGLSQDLPKELVDKSEATSELVQKTSPTGDQSKENSPTTPLQNDGSKNESVPMDIVEVSEQVPMQVDQDGNSEKIKRDKEWVDMVDGIAMFFEQALPFRLLYRQELPQLAAIENDEELSEKPKIDIYGCEHLLRLFLRLHLFLAQEVGEGMDEEEIKAIFAKVSDLVRFLHKHQSTAFAQTFRKPNEAELKEQAKIEKARERKRKRQMKLTEQEGTVEDLDIEATKRSKVVNAPDQ
jgi:hypothetical protein